MENERQILGYCERCRKDRFFRPVLNTEDSAETAWECTMSCGLHTVGEPPEAKNGLFVQMSILKKKNSR